MGIENTTGISIKDVASTVGVGAQSFGAVYAALGARNKSISDQAAYNYQASVQANNAKLDEMRAQDSLARGAKAEQDARMRTAALKGTQRANLAARGLDLGEGSALSILSDTDFMGERDALVIRDNAAMDAWGFRETAKNKMADSTMLRNRASNESPTGAMLGTLLTGAGQVAGSWYKMTKGA